MHPITFTKDHPVAVITCMALGMIAGPWALSMIESTTGVSVGLPRVSRGGGS